MSYRARIAGFTLVELLVVVAIIALLVSILLPSLSAARDQSRSIKCMANMRDMWTGVNTFAANHRGRFQLVTVMGSSTQPLMGHMPADPQKAIYDYETGVPSPNLLVWPIVLLREQGIRSLRRNLDWGAATESGARLAASKGRIRRYEVLSCPSDQVQFATPHWPLKDFWGYLSYAINEDITGARTDADKPVWKNGNIGGTPGGGDRLWGQLDKVVRPSEVAFFSDGGPDRSGEGDQSQNLLITKDAHGPLLEYSEQKHNRLPNRHRGYVSVNITYADGHGGFVKRIPKTPANPAIEPNYAYAPKTRVSPYASGNFPTP